MSGDVLVEPAWLRSLVREIPDFPNQVSPSVTSPRCSATPQRSAVPSTSSPSRFADLERRSRRRRRVARLHPRRARRLPAWRAAFVPVRKAGKLPWAVVREEYQLEYGADKLEIHRDAIHPDERMLIVDDVLATGGTAAATARLVEALGRRSRRHRHPDRARRPRRTGRRSASVGWRPWRATDGHRRSRPAMAAAPRGRCARRADPAARQLPAPPSQGAGRHDQPRLPGRRRGAPQPAALERRELHQPPARRRPHRRRHRSRRDLRRRRPAPRRRRGHRDHARRRGEPTSAPRWRRSSTASPSSSASSSTRARRSRRRRCARCWWRWRATCASSSSSSPTGCTTCARSPRCRWRSSSASPTRRSTSMPRWPTASACRSSSSSSRTSPSPPCTRSASPSSTTSSAAANPSARSTWRSPSPRSATGSPSSASTPRSPAGASTCGASTRRWSSRVASSTTSSTSSRCA